MEVNRDVTRRDILYGVLKRMDEVIDSISNTWRCWKTCSRKRVRIKETR